MMDDLDFKCCRPSGPADGVTFSDEEFGEVLVACTDGPHRAVVCLSRQDAEALRDWLVTYLR